jgi:hypothetical protein
MASEHPGSQRAASERKPIKQPTRPSPQNGPPVLGDGLESPRSSDC